MGLQVIGSPEEQVAAIALRRPMCRLKVISEKISGKASTFNNFGKLT
jgi:hypothetical protein